MKIGIGVNHFAPLVGGCETVTKTIAEYLSTEHDVYIFTRKVKNRNLRSYSNLNIIEHFPGDYRSFQKSLSGIKPDVFIIYSDVFDFFRHLAFKKNDFDLILALCGANWLYANKNYINILNRNTANIKKIICHSPYERDYKLCSSGNFKDKTIIIPNGIDRSEFNTNNLTREDLNRTLKDKIWILNVSNFFPGKGQEHMVSILSDMKNVENIVYLQVASDIDFSVGQKLEIIWNKSVNPLIKRGMNVMLLKNLKRDQVIGYFKNSNVLAFTSEKEVAPLVLLESMAAQLPWVSTNVGNAEGLKGGICIATAKDQKYHSIFDNRVKGLFVKGIEECIKYPKIAEAGNKQIKNELNWEKILPMYKKVIEHEA